MTKQRILYIQHAGAMGGSTVSLQFLVEGLDRTRYEPVIACIHPTPAVLDYHRSTGAETFYWPGISPFMHTTGGWYPLYDPLAWPKLIRCVTGWQASVHAAEALIRQVQPDIVHLNSVVLPQCAIAAKKCDVKLVWHVLESVVHGHLGLRRAWLGRLIRRLADEVIFISEDNRQQLFQDGTGVVIPCAVDFAYFDRAVLGDHVKTAEGISPEAKVIVFLGGRSVIKGVFPLLEAMPIIQQALPEVHLLVTGGAYHFSGRMVSRIARTVLPLVGSGTIAQRVDKLIARHNLAECVHMLAWREDLPALISAGDVLVAPWTEPHFARPVIEAGAMAKPVVASRIGGVEELVQDGVTGLLVPPNDPAQLAAAVIRVLSDTALARQMGEAGYAQALARFSQAANVQATMMIYRQVST